jgi:hypothetical protein
MSVNEKIMTSKIIENFKEKLTTPQPNEKGEIEIRVEPEIVTESQSSLFIFLLKEKEERIM